MFTLFRRKPITALLSSLSLLRGKAAFKAEIARQVTLDPILWISRIWLLAHRGKLDEDPVVFALTDRLSPALGLVALLIVRGAV